MKHNLLSNRFTAVAVTLIMAIALTGSTGAVPAFASDKSIEQVYLGEPKHVWWETDTVGKWNTVSKAQEYQVKLYIADYVDRDEDNWRSINWEDEEMEAVMTKRTTETSCDFTEYMNDLHSYFFVVRATPKVSQQAYVTAGSWVASPTIDYRNTAVQGITEGKWRNYLEGTMYEDIDQNTLSNGWFLIKGTWYLFDADGYLQTGWQTIDGNRYYLGENGAMSTGWFVYGDNWYYAAKDGAIQTGWIMDLPGKYYYLYEDGTMAHDVEIDGYWLNSSGLRS
ncbi:MAG: hypothetical protein ACRDBO_20825 [Lachnospiraceae bacterium]